MFICQTGGCIVSLYLISPKMTLITMGVLPVVIAVGTIFGSLLRVLSRKTQAQNALANSVADEAFGNIRTVRAFAMEDAEEGSVCNNRMFPTINRFCRLFKQEVLHAQRLNELLGAGIGLFQGATNLFLNGK
jgi:ATP-binding cassette subfamily B (MDR/TAP) protein 8